MREFNLRFLQSCHFFISRNLKSTTVKYFVILLKKINHMLQNFSPLRNHRITPIGYFNKPNIKHSKSSMKNLFDGTAIMGLLAPGDWPLYEDFLYCENLIVIGGFKGQNLFRFLEKQNIEKIHVYEPIPEFASEIDTEDSRILIYTEAVGPRNDLEDMVVSSDFSYLSTVERPKSIPNLRTIKVQMSDWTTLCARFKGRYTIFLNCEGSEYNILTSLFEHCKKGGSGVHLPEVIIFQSHIVEPTPAILLTNLRATIAEYYDPLLTLDWAWDIWISRS